METITAGCQSSNRRHYRFPAQGDSSHFQNVRLDGFCLTVKGQSKTPPSRVCSIAMRSWSVASLKKQNVGEMFLVSQYSRARGNVKRFACVHQSARAIRTISRRTLNARQYGQPQQPWG